jgi:hypothetical protein
MTPDVPCAATTRARGTPRGRGGWPLRWTLLAGLATLAGVATGCLSEFAIDAGHLLCAPSLVRCEEACTSLADDPQHCGECGRACDDGLVCVEGDCTVGDGGGDGDGDDCDPNADGDCGDGDGDDCDPSADGDCGDGDGDDDTDPVDMGGECDPATGQDCEGGATDGDCDPSTGENCGADGSAANARDDASGGA